jgi:CDP-2,3-bis-(O-geranylgeranyl)-sn-glycerol synthase
MDSFWFAFWFFIPAGIANATPIFLAKTPGLTSFTYPVDGGHSFRGQRIFGDHKTWRGVVGGILAAIIVVLLQVLAYNHSSWVREISMQVDYPSIAYITLGFLLGFGALLGDMVKSFVKRQLNVAPGTSWFPFDQLDYIFGALVLSSLMVHLSAIQYLWVFVIWFALHILVSYLGYISHFKDSKI